MKRKLGICEWSLPVSGATAIEIAAEAGFEGMQIGEAGGRLAAFPLKNQKVQESYNQAALKYGIKLHSLNLGALLSEGTLNYLPDSSCGRHAIESLTKGFEACEKMNIRTVVITADPRNEEQLKNSAAHLRLASRMAEEAGIEIAVESAIPIEEIYKLLDFSGAFEDRSRIKICMDILNPLRFGSGDPCGQMTSFGKDMISHFHLKDSKKELFVPGQRGCVLLGTGDGKYEQSVKIINDMGFEGWLMTENYYYLPPMNDGEADFIALASCDLETMKKSFKEDGRSAGGNI